MKRSIALGLSAAMLIGGMTISSPAFAVNPHTLVMKERMQKAEEKLLAAEKAKGKEQTLALSEHLQLLRSNIESMNRELIKLNGETDRMNRLTMVSQLVAHEKKMNRYHADVITMLHQMVRSQILLLKIVKKSSAKPAP
jgi:hypothetical protein